MEGRGSQRCIELLGAEGGEEMALRNAFVRHSHPGWLVRSPTLSQHVTYFSQQDDCVCTCPGFTFQLLFLCKQWSQKRNLGIERTFDWVLAHVFKPNPVDDGFIWRTGLWLSCFNVFIFGKVLVPEREMFMCSQ